MTATKEAPSRNKIGWISIVALALSGSNVSLLLFGGLLNGQGTMGLGLLAVGIITSWLALPGWIELVLLYPNRVGGIGASAAWIFGKYCPPLSCLIGIGYWIAWGSGCAFGVNVTATALHAFYPQLSVTAIATYLLIGLTALNLIGLKWTARVFVLNSTVALSLAILAVMIPILTQEVNWQKAVDFELIVPFPGLFGQFTGVMAGLYLIAFSAPAFENALCYVRETKDPAKNVPRAAYACAAITALYYIVIPIIWLGALGIESLSKDSLSTELVSLFEPIFIGPVAKLMALLFVITNFLVITAGGIAGISRTLAQIAQDGFAPEIFGQVSKDGTPRIAILATFMIVGTMVLFDTPNWLLAGTNLSYLTCICLASVAVWLARRTEPTLTRLYRAPRGMIALGLVSTFIWFLSIIFGYQQYSLESVIFGIIFVFSPLIFYIYRKLRDNYKAGKLTLGRAFFDTLHIKLTVAMLGVLSLNAVGYLIAVNNLVYVNSPLVTLLEDIFIFVALLTIAVGLIMPSIIVNAATQISDEATKLTKGTLADFSRAMIALSQGDLEKAKAEINIKLVPQYSRDEIGLMAKSFNDMQQEIAHATLGLTGAREGLIKSRKELKNLNLKLEERVFERTQELQSTLDNLRTTQDQLIESKKLAGLGGLVAGVAHEVNTPIGICVTATSQLNNELNEITAAFTKDKLKRQHLNEFLKIASDSLFLIEHNLKRAADLIKSFKEVSADNVSEACRSFSLKVYLEDVIASLKPLFKQTKIKTHIECDENLSITNYPGVLFRVITILVTNSIKHAFDADQPGTISIIVTSDANKVTIVYKDDGKGIAPQDLDKVFTPFFTTKRHAGIGLGCHIAYNSVVKILAGNISCQSKLGEGVIFTITIPKT